MRILDLTNYFSVIPKTILKKLQKKVRRVEHLFDSLNFRSVVIFGIVEEVVDNSLIYIFHYDKKKRVFLLSVKVLFLYSEILIIFFHWINIINNSVCRRIAELNHLFARKNS